MLFHPHRNDWNFIPSYLWSAWWPRRSCLSASVDLCEVCWWAELWLNACWQPRRVRSDWCQRPCHTLKQQQEEEVREIKCAVVVNEKWPTCQQESIHFSLLRGRIVFDRALSSVNLLYLFTFFLSGLSSVFMCSNRSPELWIVNTNSYGVKDHADTSWGRDGLPDVLLLLLHLLSSSKVIWLPLNLYSDCPNAPVQWDASAHTDTHIHTREEVTLTINYCWMISNGKSEDSGYRGASQLQQKYKYGFVLMLSSFRCLTNTCGSDFFWPIVFSQMKRKGAYLSY